MHVMNRDKELVISLILDDHALFPRGGVHGLDTQIFADAVIAMDDIIAFLEFKKMIEWHLGVKNAAP